MLGKDNDAREYEALYQRITEAYRVEFIHQHGRIRPEKQASYVRALAFDLVPPALQQAAVDHPVRPIQENGDHLGELGWDRAGWYPKGSPNHYCKGAVGSWLYQVVAGIEPGTPGYKHIRFQPRPGGDLTAACARYHSLYGEIASRWQMRDGTFTLTITVPANTTATVFLPKAEASQVTEGGQRVETAEGVIQVNLEQEATVVEVGSGTYAFAYLLSRNSE